MSARLRRPGSPWRLRVHEWAGRQSAHGLPYGVSHDVDDTARRRPDEEWVRHVNLPGTEFDELVVGSWLHVEQMNARQWWMNVGGVTLWVTADRDGRPRHVTVLGPGEYDAPRDGCAYECSWPAVGGVQR